MNIETGIGLNSQQLGHPLLLNPKGSRPPNLLKEKIAFAMLIRGSSGIRTQAHDLPIARGAVGGPVRHSRTVRISASCKVGPESLHQIGKLVVLGPELCSLARVQVAEHVLNLIGVEGAGREGMERISRRRECE